MTHPREGRLIELASGRLPAADADELMKHLADCPQCGQAWREIEQIYRGLEGWRETAVQVDLVDRVQAAIDVPGGGSIRLFPTWIRAAGIAASIAASLLGGHLIAWSLKQPAPEAFVPPSAIEDHLQLAVLASPDRTGISEMLDTDLDLEGVTP